MRMTRRRFLAAAAGALAAAAAPVPVRAQAKPYAGQTLNVFTYAGAYETGLRRFLIPAFEQRTGARVVLDPGWWDMLPKLKASPPGQPVYDLVMTDPTQGQPAIVEGLFQHIGLDGIPNAKLIVPRLQDDWYQKNAWGVNFAGSIMVIAFNTEIVPKPPRHWHDLLAPELKGKLSLYDAPYQSLYAFAQMKAGAEGRPGRGYDELKKDLGAVLRFAVQHRDIVRVWWTSTGDFMAKLLQREVAGGVAHNTGPLVAESEGKPVVTVSPPEGTAIVQVFWSIPGGTRVKRLAEEFINDFYATDFQVKWGTTGKIAVTNLQAAAIAAREDAAYARFLPSTPQQWSAIRYYPYDVYFEGNNWARITDTWEREVLRKKG